MRTLAHYRSAVIVAILTILLAGTVTVLLDRSERAAVEEVSVTQAAVVSASLQAAASAGMTLVDSVGGLFDASTQVTPAEFSAFAARSMDRSPAFRVVQYSEVVAQADRAQYEAGLAARGYPWGIRVPTVDGGVRPAPLRPRYVAVTMQQPVAGNVQAFGLDIASRPAAAALIDRVTSTGEPGMGAWSTLVQTGQPALYIYAPVYATRATPATAAQREEALMGIAGTVFLYGDALAAVPTDPAVEYVVIDPAAQGGQPTLLYSSSGAQPSLAEAQGWPALDEVVAGGMRFVVAARPLPGAQPAGAPPWLAGLLVLGVGLMLAAFLVRTTEQRRLVRVTGELQSANERLQFLSDHDSLTGLLGRDAAQRLLDEWMTTSISGQAPHVAAMFIDIDRFGSVNATWGHPVGDAVLRQLSERLQYFVDEATLIARVGGDEFLLLRVGRDLVDLRVPATARGIQRTLAEPVQVGESRQSFTTSVGVALFPIDASDAQELIAKADAAVRSAKALGSGQVVIYNREVEAAEAERIGIEREVSMALREPDVPFHMVYQPQVRMTDGACVGLEALIRWPAHPAGPDQFIPVAERSGLIVPLGRYVAQAVVRQVRAWRTAGLDVPLVSFNVSADQFVEDFATRLIRLLEDESVDPARIEVEVTEYSAMRSSAQDQLEKLRRHGVRIAIDDFGTGFSSLARLSHLPVDRLKIDRSFIAGLPEDATAVEVVRTIADLSRSFHLEVVCEGVQTDAQAVTLMGFGLEIAQGFRYARPMRPTEVPDYLAGAGTPVLTID